MYQLTMINDNIIKKGTCISILKIVTHLNGNNVPVDAPCISLNLKTIM